METIRIWTISNNNISSKTYELPENWVEFCEGLDKAYGKWFTSAKDLCDYIAQLKDFALSIQGV